MHKLLVFTIVWIAFTAPSSYAADSLSICSFNVQFLGSSVRRDDPNLARILEPFDIVVVQELVSPPFEGVFPDGTAYRPDSEAAEFFDAMRIQGFEFKLSEEDTGKSATNHNNGSATEWFVVFYKKNSVSIAADLPNGFLADDRTAHPNFDRVPYAFAFRDESRKLDFVLISVHLRPGASEDVRRKEELEAIAEWVNQNNDIEKDFIILGDMNIEDAEELDKITPRGFRSLNDECRATNTNLFGPKPYDHVMYRSSTTSRELDKRFDFRVYNLIEAMRPFWSDTEPYPGGAINPISSPKYDHNRFRSFYSDHHPIVFRMLIPADDDDG